MYGGTDVKCNFISFNNKDIRSLCLFAKVRCIVKYCAFGFFYLLKEKHCRSPPQSIRSKNELIGGKRYAIWSRFI